MTTRLSPEQRLDRLLTEKDFMSQIIELAHLYRWRVAHFRPAWTGRGWRTPVQGDGAGFPDLLLTRGQRLVVAELKREKGGVVSGEQADWLLAFGQTGCEVHVWQPSDFDNIVEALR